MEDLVSGPTPSLRSQHPLPPLLDVGPTFILPSRPLELEKPYLPRQPRDLSCGALENQGDRSRHIGELGRRSVRHQDAVFPHFQTEVTRTLCDVDVRLALCQRDLCIRPGIETVDRGGRAKSGTDLCEFIIEQPSEGANAGEGWVESLRFSPIRETTPVDPVFRSAHEPIMVGMQSRRTDDGKSRRKAA